MRPALLLTGSLAAALNPAAAGAPALRQGITEIEIMARLAAGVAQSGQ